MKKQFPCGHIGKGAVCGRCIQETSFNKQMKEAKQKLHEIGESLRRQERQRKDDLFSIAKANDVVVPRGCPDNVILTAIELIKRIRSCENIVTLGGKKLYRSQGIAFRFGWSWRGIYSKNQLRVMTHEEYNTFVGGKSKRGR